MPKLRAPEFW